MARRLPLKALGRSIVQMVVKQMNMVIGPLLRRAGSLTLSARFRAGRRR
ncbi:hypothetical protein T261_5062 [Streptomyces lydicus]|nr:hypothetical protein T261_5062 [Streptomyces lydicus]